jgi:hypothetical protein
MAMMRELKAGLWHWQAPHPEWEGKLAGGRPKEPWNTLVSSYALLDDEDRLLLFDPLAVPGELEELAAGRKTAVVLTAPWHERDTRLLIDRHQWPVYTPPPESEDDLMERFGVTREQVAGGSPDLRWLMEGDYEKHLLAAGDRPPLGLDVLAGRAKHELVYWIEQKRAVLVGDALADLGDGLELNAWTSGDGPRELADALRPLLSLPVELVLPAHGAPADRAALERALS